MRSQFSIRRRDNHALGVTLGRYKKRQLRLQLISTVRNGGLGREGIGTSVMMQLVDCTIDNISSSLCRHPQLWANLYREIKAIRKIT